MEALARYPKLRDGTIAHRAWVLRAVRIIVGELGINQIIDLGAGIPPTKGETVHQVAQRINPNARILYVDKDPAVLAGARALLYANEQTTYVEADFRDTSHVLTVASDHLDLAHPTAVLAGAALHYVPPEDIRPTIDAYTITLSSNSCLAFSHLCDEQTAPDLMKMTQQAFPEYPIFYRSRSEIESLFPQGWAVIPPGVTHIETWRPDTQSELGPLHQLCGIAVKP